MPDRTLEYRVPAAIKPARADKVFAGQFDGVSRARLQRAFAAGQVTFDGAIIDQRFKIDRAGLLRAVLSEPETDEAPRPVAQPLDIVHEDASIIVVNKAPGMVVHPGSGTGADTLVHALLHHCGGQLSSVGAPHRPGIVHRLDKETSGLIIVAKTDRAHHRLAEAFSQRAIDKRYTALVLGLPAKRKGIIEAPIGRHPVVRTRMAVVARGRPARTDWECAPDQLPGYTLVRCRIHTGRTHQIRVHMSHLGHPLLGDATYGFRKTRLPAVEIPRVMLHATQLSLSHPDSGHPLTLQSPLPKDFQALLQ